MRFILYRKWEYALLHCSELGKCGKTSTDFASTRFCNHASGRPHSKIPVSNTKHFFFLFFFHISWQFCFWKCLRVNANSIRTHETSLVNKSHVLLGRRFFLKFWACRHAPEVNKCAQCLPGVPVIRSTCWKSGLVNFDEVPDRISDWTGVPGAGIRKVLVLTCGLVSALHQVTSACLSQWQLSEGSHGREGIGPGLSPWSGATGIKPGRSTQSSLADPDRQVSAR